jgi:hypothetical protein
MPENELFEDTTLGDLERARADWQDAEQRAREAFERYRALARRWASIPKPKEVA